jgi:hypothetical protein
VAVIAMKIQTNLQGRFLSETGLYNRLPFKNLSNLNESKQGPQISIQIWNDKVNKFMKKS